MLTGPTAVGKTEVSLLLAQRLGGEIISADSVQVYRGLDIGSAKVTDHLTALLYTQRGDPMPEQIDAAALVTAPVRFWSPSLAAPLLTSFGSPTMSQRFTVLHSMAQAPCPEEGTPMMCLRWSLDCCVCSADFVDTGSGALHIVLWSAVLALLGGLVAQRAPVLLLTAEPFLSCMQIMPEERLDIPHHLLDILEPSQDFSAGDFFETGRAATQAILQVSSITTYRSKVDWWGAKTALFVGPA